MLHEVPDPSQKLEFNDHRKSLDDIMYETDLLKYSMAFDM